MCFEWLAEKEHIVFYSITLFVFVIEMRGSLETNIFKHDLFTLLCFRVKPQFLRRAEIFCLPY
jgi:hypothetical protein